MADDAAPDPSRPPDKPVRVHATCVLVGTGGILLRGDSGAGKSDLALRLIDRGAKLVADDQTLLTRTPNGLQATAPEPLSGRMEVRGVGIIQVPVAPSAMLRAVFDLSPPDTIPRLPELESVCLVEGASLPLWRVDPFEASAPLKIALLADASPLGQREISD